MNAALALATSNTKEFEPVTEYRLHSVTLFGVDVRWYLAAAAVVFIVVAVLVARRSLRARRRHRVLRRR